MKKEIKKNDHLYYSSDPSSYGEERDFPNVIGWKVKASNDQVIGTVNQLVVSKDANKVVYLDVETDQKIKDSEEELYGQPEDFSEGKFTNKDGENHLIIPIGLATVNEDLKSIKTEEIEFQTFTIIKRIKKDIPISREYELIILNTYRSNTGKEEKDQKDKNRLETNKDNTTMEKSGTTTDHNISDKKRDKDPIRNKNGEEIEKIKFSDDAESTSRPKESDAEKKSKKDGVIGEIGKENRINKPSDNTNITASPGEIADDFRDIESEVDAKMRKENIQKSSKNSTDSSKESETRAKSKITGKEDKKQKTLEVPGTSVNPTNKKETYSESKKATSSSGKSTSDSGSSKSKSSDSSSGSGSSKSSFSSNRGTASSSSNKGSYVTMDYHEYTKDELYQRAQEVDLEGRSQMNKDELVKALYDSHTKEELYDRASEADISGRSNMSKTQLINALQRTDNDKSSSGNSTKSSSTNSSSSQSKSFGSTSSKSSNSSSSSSGTDYYRLTREELYEKAKQKDIEGRSQMSKDELLDALYEDHTREDLYEKASRANIKGRSKMSKKKLIDELKKS